MRHTRAFLAVARLGNFTRASRYLYVSQPTLTVQIKQLEEFLGVSLFDRNNRRVQLTQAGQDLIAPLERILTDIEAVVSGVKDTAGLRKGRVTVAAVPSIAAKLLPRSIGEFSKSYPGVSVRLIDVVAANMIELIKAGEVDFGIGSHLRDDPEIGVQPLFLDEICAIVHKGHPLCKKKTVSLKEIEDYRVILTQRDTIVRRIVDHALEANKVYLKDQHETNHMSTAVGMVEANLGIAILPLAGLDEVDKRRVRAIPIDKPRLARQVSVIFRDGRSLTNASEKLIEIIKSVANHPSRSALRADR